MIDPKIIKATMQLPFENIIELIDLAGVAPLYANLDSKQKVELAQALLIHAMTIIENQGGIINFTLLDPVSKEVTFYTTK